MARRFVAAGLIRPDLVAWAAPFPGQTTASNLVQYATREAALAVRQEAVRRLPAVSGPHGALTPRPPLG